ncbi:MAG: hypothetical protein IT530_16115 [Burkholderiales bacterium]|nr:hypothetical protein [Burkholderiales bacterium]
MNRKRRPGPPRWSETIEWRSAARELPDSDIVVLVGCPDEDEPVWLGWFDAADNRWVSVNADEIEVTWWADVPIGPARPGAPS